MNPEHKQCILDNAGKMSIKDIAAHLCIKEKAVRKVLDNSRDEIASPPSESARKPISSKMLVSVLLIVLLGFAVYVNSFNGEFLWDDESLVENNPFIRSWSYLPNILSGSIKASVGQQSDFYRPVQMFTYLIDYSIWGQNVVGYHLANTIYHILAALCVYWLIRVLFRDDLLALFTGILYVCHPVHTEAVTYISGRADSLMAIFTLLSVIFYVKNLDERRVGYSILICLCCILGFMSRENSLMIPFMLLLVHLVVRKPLDKIRFSVVVALEGGYIWLRSILLSAEYERMIEGPSLFERLPGFFVAFTQYLRILVLPFGLHMEYGGILYPFGEPQALMGLAVFVVVAALVVKTRKNQLVFFGSLWFLVMLAPQSNVMYTLNAFMAEHWLYIPSIGFFVIVARLLVFIYRDKDQKVAAIFAIVALTAFLSVMTVIQNRIWLEPVRFYTYTLEKAPYASRVCNNLAKALYDAGREEDLVVILEAAIEADEANSEAWNNLGNAYKGVGRFHDAKVSYEKSISLGVTHAGPFYNYALMFSDKANLSEDYDAEKAMGLLRQALDMNPYFIQAYHKIGLIRSEQGRYQEAIDEMERALQLNIDSAMLYHSLGYIYVQQGDQKKALEMYQKAVVAGPTYAKAYHDMAILHYGEGRYQEAIRCYEEARALGHDDPALRNALKPHRK